jgi:hypothetical protein
VSYIKYPQKIFGNLRKYVDAAVDYQPRTDLEPDPAKIQSRTIHLAIPEYTSPEQWRYLMGAIGYGREHGVSIIITRIRE